MVSQLDSSEVSCHLLVIPGVTGSKNFFDLFYYLIKFLTLNYFLITSSYYPFYVFSPTVYLNYLESEKGDYLSKLGRP